MDRLAHRRDVGALVFGALLLLAGGYYFLRNTLGFDLGEIDWDMIWPIVLIVLGVGIVYRAMLRSQNGEPKQ